jgi:hypothetical protein
MIRKLLFVLRKLACVDFADQGKKC